MLEHQLPLALVEGRGPSGSKSPDHDGLDLRGGKARHGSPIRFALQHGLRDIVAIPARCLLRMGRGHGVAALVFDAADKTMLGGKLLAAAWWACEASFACTLSQAVSSRIAGCWPS